LQIAEDNLQSAICNLQSAVLALLLAVAAVSPCRAAPPADELLRLVPEDVGFCLVVQDLRHHAETLLASPFARTLQKSALAAVLKQSPEIQKLAAIDEMLRRSVGLDLTGIRDQLVGDAVVLAYWPNPPGQTDRDRGMLLVRARDAKVPASFIERLNRVQKEAGDLVALHARQIHGVTYHERVDRKKKHFYYLHGPVLLVSTQEEVLCLAIQRAQQTTTGESALVRQLRSFRVDQSLACLWINPRAFEAEMERNAARAKGEAAAGQRAFLRYWKVLDGIVLSLSLKADVQLRLMVQARMKDLPAAVPRILFESGKPSDLWRRFPPNALLTVAGRLDVSAALAGFEDFLTAPARQHLRDILEQNIGGPAGKDFHKDILPALGPDVGLCVLAPPPAQPTWTPDVLLAVRVGPGPAEAEERVDQAVFTALTFYARLVLLGYNRTGKGVMRLKTMTSDQGEVKYLAGDGLWLPGVQPAFALRHGYLVLASSPEVLRRFGADRQPEPARADGAVPLLRLSARELRRFATQRRAALVQASIDRDRLSRDEASRRLDGLLALLELIDGLEVTRQTQDGAGMLTLRIETAQPLK
jgi:hypothetical protein